MEVRSDADAQLFVILVYMCMCPACVRCFGSHGFACVVPFLGFLCQVSASKRGRTAYTLHTFTASLHALACTHIHMFVCFQTMVVGLHWAGLGWAGFWAGWAAGLGWPGPGRAGLGGAWAGLGWAFGWGGAGAGAGAVGLWLGLSEGLD